jgi:hypothetical protein
MLDGQKQYLHGASFATTEDDIAAAAERFARVVEFAKSEGFTLIGGRTTSVLTMPDGTPIESYRWADEKPWALTPETVERQLALNSTTGHLTEAGVGGGQGGSPGI